ncbi:MAG TPA: hypothetical protein VGP68_00530 [Gemmataceae bacterium]|jgi:hypothetical protein|nr:hypothetical protein [Gemmataceae bacterium]
MNFEGKAILFGFLLPGLVSFLGLASASRLGSNRSRSGLGALAFGLIPLWYFSLGLGTSLWPAENWQWLAWLGIVACLIHVVTGNKWILGIFYSLFVVLAAWLLVPHFERLADERWYWLIAVSLVLLISLGSCMLLAQRLGGPALPCYWLLASLAAVLLVFCASILTFAQLGGIFAGVIAGCCVASWLFPTRSLTSAIAPGWAVVYPALLIEAKLYTFSEVPFLSYLLLVCAPLTIWLTALPGVRKMKSGWRFVLGFLLLMTPITVGLYWGGQVAIDDMTETEMPAWLLRILRQLLGKPPLMNVEE